MHGKWAKGHFIKKTSILTVDLLHSRETKQSTRNKTENTKGENNKICIHRLTEFIENIHKIKNIEDLNPTN